MAELKSGLFSSLKVKEKIWIILLISILIWGGYYRAVHCQNRCRIKGLRSRIREIQDKTFKAEDQISPSYLRLEKRLEDVKQDFKLLERGLDSIYSEMFRTDHTSELLKYLTAKHVPDSLEFIFMKAGELEQKNFYQKMPLTISLSGKYNQITAYLKRLEYVSRFLKVTSLKLTADPDILPLLNAQMSLAAILQGPGRKKPSVFSQRPAKIDSEDLQTAKLLDPFTTFIPSYLISDKESGLPQLKDLGLSGVIWRGDVPSAVIDGRAVIAGDDIKGLKVLEILEDGVILKRKGEKVKLKLKLVY
ncbi:MAG: type 4a pilus biogenesis protein PilO [Candidatus Omnitrophota bacterium]|nr:type 4a pilus biogenesis protein PilO [Candidatus Omnitrophota bacterium]